MVKKLLHNFAGSTEGKKPSGRMAEIEMYFNKAQMKFPCKEPAEGEKKQDGL